MFKIWWSCCLFCFESYCLHLHWLILLLVGVSSPFYSCLNWCINLGGHHSLGRCFVLIEITLCSGFLCCFFLLFLLFLDTLVYFLNLTVACQFPCLWLFLFANFQYMTVYLLLYFWILKFNLHLCPFSTINSSISHRRSVPLILIDDINIFSAV